MLNQKKQLPFWLRAGIMIVPLVVVSIVIWLFGRTNPLSDTLFGALLGLAVLWFIVRAWQWHQQIENENRQIQNLLGLMRDFSLPVAFLSAEGTLLWQNLQFQSLHFSADHQKKLQSLSVGAHFLRFDIHDQLYDAYIERAHTNQQYWLLMVPSSLTNKQARTEDRLPIIGYIQVDNYVESADQPPNDRILLNGVIDDIEALIVENGGFSRSYDRGKLLIVMDRASLQTFRENKFSFLDQIRQVKLNSGVSVSLSIAIGMEETIRHSVRSAQEALELALGRGGDQAVVKEKGKYYFYGGKSQQTERYSRVKSRVFATSLGNLMRQYDNVLIMGHKMADMDALGAAVGMACTAMAQKKTVYVVVEQNNAMIAPFFQSAMQDAELRELIISAEIAMTRCTKKTLLIVVDTQRSVATAAPALLDCVEAVVVMDHHLRGVDHNINATLQMTEPRASSTCELVCEALQYFSPDVKLSSLMASAILCGIIVDTKNFTKNTSARTFEAAAYLQKHGAGSKFVRQIFLESKQSYLDRADIVRAAENITEQIVLSICPSHIQDAALVSAQAADALVNIKGIEAAFVLSHGENSEVNVSARSSEDVNVQIILESLGGGGHYNASGAKLKEPIERAKEEVRAAVLRYAQEKKK